METTFIMNPKAPMMSYPVGDEISYNKPIIAEMIKSFIEIEEFKDKFVNLICMGSSGAIIATIFSMTIPNENKILHIKKDGEQSHGQSIFGRYKEGLYVIVDDFIATGSTMEKIYKRVCDADVEVNPVIDCICVSGYFNKLQHFGNSKPTLSFTPRYLICADHSK